MSKLTCIARIEVHCLEPLILFQQRARPFPDTSHPSMPRQLVAILSHWDRVPILEANVAILEIDEELLGVRMMLAIGNAFTGSAGWRRFFHSIVRKVTLLISFAFRTISVGPILTRSQRKSSWSCISPLLCICLGRHSCRCFALLPEMECGRSPIWRSLQARHRKPSPASHRQA